MSGRLGIDFGTSNTVLAVWDATHREGIPMHVPEMGQIHPASASLLVDSPDESALTKAAEISVIPSLIHYAGDGRRWIGEQVRQKNLTNSDRTFSLMKRYIANRSPVARRLDGRSITHFAAGQDFLSAVLLLAIEEMKVGDEEMAFTVPVEAFEHYVDWLTRVTESIGVARFRLIDEPSAAALGYGAHIQPGHVYLIFDFGGGTLDVAVVLIEEESQSASGRRCRVLGKAGRELGGSTLDAWLFQEVLRRHGRSDSDEDVRKMSSQLLGECRAAKEKLSRDTRAEITAMNPATGAVLGTGITREEFEALLDAREMFTHMDQTVRRALNASRERGYSEDHIQSVLMVGGSSLIPSVQKAVQRIFGRDKVRLERPLDAVARGAAAYAAGMDFFDHIQHDYAIRWFNPQKGDYDYRVLVQRGTSYPTPEPIARLTIKATQPGQTQLGIAIFEVATGGTADKGVELVFDSSGAARVVEVLPEEEERRRYFWINEQSPTFLPAEPPAQKGEPRFTVEFGIDSHKRLLITARDLKTGRLTHQEFPVVKLT
ncbi:MAG: Hsp70 family protein [Verrucomicrobiota bacterium]